MPKFLTRKFGPLPVWGYAAIVGGVVVFLKWRAKQQANAAAASTPGQIPVALGDMSVLPNGAGYNLPPSGSSVPTSAASTTNANTTPLTSQPSDYVWPGSSSSSSSPSVGPGAPAPSVTSGTVGSFGPVRAFIPPTMTGPGGQGRVRL